MLDANLAVVDVQIDAVDANSGRRGRRRVNRGRILVMDNGNSGLGVGLVYNCNLCLLNCVLTFF